MERFIQLDHQLLCDLLNRDTLHVNERDLLMAVALWVERACGENKVEPEQRNKLQSALRAHVRCLGYSLEVYLGY